MPVAELIVHLDNNITHKIHDIALLKLGMKWYSNLYGFIQIKGERVDLTKFPPVCLPSHGQNFDGSLGMVYGDIYYSLL